jgi:opacity protein-like surface antigen
MDKRKVTSIVGGVSLALVSSAAFADGMPSLKDTVVAPAPTWSGPYFGGSIGYGRNDSKNIYSDTSGESSSVSEDADGGLVSLVWGLDCQVWERFVVGAFVDVDWSDIERGDKSNGLTIDRSFAIGGRFGALITPRTLAFVTAGYTRAHFDNDNGWWDILANGVGPNLPGKNSEYFDGYFLGGGLETMLGNNFFLRGEVRYSKYGTEVTNSGSFGGDDYVDKEDPELWTGRIGLVYKLGRGEPFHGSDYGSDGTIKAITYSGIDVAKDIWSLYSGGVYALNGDFSRNGLVARTFGIYSDYSYETGGSDIDAEDRMLDVMLGYMHYFGSTSAIVYVGMEVRDVDLSPDDTSNEVRGTEAGFKVAFELETGDDRPYYFGLDTSYSTAFDTFYGNVRVGLNKNGVKFGPEGEIWSEEGDASTRLGAFVMFPFQLSPRLPLDVSIAGGYQWVDDDDNGFSGGSHGGEGAYVNSYVKFSF